MICGRIEIIAPIKKTEIPSDLKAETKVRAADKPTVTIKMFKPKL